MPAISIEKVFQSSNKFNILVTDCEGYDLELIEAVLNINPLFLEVIQFENLSPDKDQLNRIISKLYSMGFSLRRYKHDYIFYKALT